MYANKEKSRARHSYYLKALKQTIQNQLVEKLQKKILKTT